MLIDPWVVWTGNPLDGPMAGTLDDPRDPLEDPMDGPMYSADPVDDLA